MCEFLYLAYNTQRYNCGYSHGYLCKNWRLRHPYALQPPTVLDSQTYEQYEAELANFNMRKNYIEGVHVKT